MRLMDVGLYRHNSKDFYKKNYNMKAMNRKRMTTHQDEPFWKISSFFFFSRGEDFEE